MRVTAENDSPEFRERLREVEDVLDGTRAWTKRVSDKSRAVTKALGSLTEAMEGFVDVLMDEVMRTHSVEGAASGFVASFEQLVPIISVFQSLVVAWLGGMPQTIAEPFRDFHRNGFDRYDEERKRYARARSAMESAYSNAKKAAAKKNADEMVVAQAELEYNTARVSLDEAALELCKAINALDTAKSTVLVGRVRQYLADARRFCEDGVTYFGQNEDVLNDVEATAEQVSTVESADHMTYAIQAGELQEKKRLIRRGTFQPASADGMAAAGSKCGWVYKQSKNVMKDWKKRWAVLKDGHFRLYHFPSETRPAVDLDVALANVKPAVDASRPHCFTMISVNRVYLLQATSDADMAEWMSAIMDATLAALNRIKSATTSKEATMRDPLEADKISGAEIESVFDELAMIPGNGQCADCWVEAPEWCSINFGIMICIECSGVHRSMGTHVSKVRSFKLDDFDPEVIDLFRAMGNERANAVLEGVRKYVVRFKPTNAGAAPMREAYIKRKYVDKQIVEAAESDNLAVLGENLLGAALERDPADVIKCICQGSDPDYASAELGGKTALHLSSEAGALEAATALVLNGASPTVADAEGNHPIHHAARNGHLGVVKMLMRNGADLTASNGDRMTPRSLATQYSHSAVADMIWSVEDPAGYAASVADGMESPSLILSLADGEVSSDDDEIECDPFLDAAETATADVAQDPGLAPVAESVAADDAVAGGSSETALRAGSDDHNAPGSNPSDPGPPPTKRRPGTYRFRPLPSPPSARDGDTASEIAVSTNGAAAVAGGGGGGGGLVMPRSGTSGRPASTRHRNGPPPAKPKRVYKGRAERAKSNPTPPDALGVGVGYDGITPEMLDSIKERPRVPTPPTNAAGARASLTPDPSRRFDFDNPAGSRDAADDGASTGGAPTSGDANNAAPSEGGGGDGEHQPRVRMSTIDAIAGLDDVMADIANAAEFSDMGDEDGGA